ncbi:hypothetical protein MtrunA17_Chr6g0474361 [Medicago truncatula]|uniref:Uncharacterized protein n=1 Tax=Medicago truncatula TaxID=3880 RepID=A0A396HM22_MEDTR|nr:hypothetical protein MtrunA17_Chr6g0474361 [Medicago truncatula]
MQVLRIPRLARAFGAESILGTSCVDGKSLKGIDEFEDLKKVSC